MNWKKIGQYLLYPHLAVIICLLPISIIFLVYSLINLSSISILAILSYLLAFYLLVVICFRIPNIIKFFKKFKQKNKFIQKWLSDVHLRINVLLYISLIWCAGFAIFQLSLGIYYKSFWFYSMFGYYFILCVMRFYLFNHTRKYRAKEQIKIEYKKYILCGWLLLFINLALTVIVFFIVYFDRTFNHSEIITITLAVYTFLSFTFAIINLVKYKKHKSPVYSASKIISLITACVSMITLETTMLTTFDSGNSPIFRRVIICFTGFAVITFAITMATIMIVRGNKQIKTLNNN